MKLSKLIEELVKILADAKGDRDVYVECTKGTYIGELLYVTVDSDNDVRLITDINSKEH